MLESVINSACVDDESVNKPKIERQIRLSRIRDLAFLHKNYYLLNKKMGCQNIDDVRKILEDAPRDNDNLDLNGAATSMWDSQKRKSRQNGRHAITLNDFINSQPKINLSLNDRLTLEAMRQRERELVNWD